MRSVARRAYRSVRTDGLVATAEKSVRYLRDELALVAGVYRRNGPIPAVLLFGELLFDRNLFLPYLDWRSDDGTVLLTATGLTDEDYSFRVSARDEGMGKGLIVYGGWEHWSSRAFPRVLETMLDEQDGDVTFLEVGANFGYYTLLAASTLGDRADIKAFEPSPSNRSLLERNVEANGYGDRVDVYPYAIGPEVTTAELGMASKANQNQILSDRSRLDAELIDTIDVEMRSIDGFLEDEGIDPGDVDVVRMDVQGYECAIVEGMESVLDADSSLAIFLETHPESVDEAEQRRLVETLSDGGFEIVHAAKNYNRLELESIDELMDESIEVILKR